jgi:hypothetical protein
MSPKKSFLPLRRAVKVVYHPSKTRKRTNLSSIETAQGRKNKNPRLAGESKAGVLFSAELDPRLSAEGRINREASFG